MAISGLNFSGGKAADAGVDHGTYGGAIYNLENLSLTRCAFVGNTANQDGGAITNDGTLAITSCIFSGNAANARGGALSMSDAITIVNSTFSNNSAKGDGGAIFDFAGGLNFLGCTIVLSRADSDGAGGGSGGGIFVNTGTFATLNNTIVAGNLVGTGATASDLGGANANYLASNSKFNLIGDAASAAGFANGGANGNIVGINGAGIRPIATILSATPANNGGPTATHALVQNSAALGAGSATIAGYVPFDQREAARDATPDIGAYEVNHPLAPVGVPSDNARTFAPHPSPDASTAFLKGLYQSTLLRNADAGGLAFWTGQLNGGQSRDQVAYGFVNSLENRSNQVAFFYRYFLNRTADSGGLAFHVARLQSGVDEGAVMTGFILSNEFSGQNNNTAFVNLMYYAILSRPADTVGFNFWTGQLQSGAQNREQVVNGFLRSNEGIGRVVSSYFQSYLKRTADASSVNSFTISLKSGTTFGAVAATLLGSSEFFGLAAGNQ